MHAEFNTKYLRKMQVRWLLTNKIFLENQIVRKNSTWRYNILDQHPDTLAQGQGHFYSMVRDIQTEFLMNRKHEIFLSILV